MNRITKFLELPFVPTNQHPICVSATATIQTQENFVGGNFSGPSKLSANLVLLSGIIASRKFARQITRAIIIISHNMG